MKVIVLLILTRWVQTSSSFTPGANTSQPVWCGLITPFSLPYETLLKPVKGYSDYKKISNKGCALWCLVVHSSALHPTSYSLCAFQVIVSLPLLIGHWLSGGKVCVVDAKALPWKLVLISFSCLNWALAPGESQGFRINMWLYKSCLFFFSSRPSAFHNLLLNTKMHLKKKKKGNFKLFVTSSIGN